MSALEEAALAYAQQGLHVFPLQPHGKTPITAHGLEDATVDAMTIETWWSRCPDANVAIRTGDVLVVDEDRLGALDELAAEAHETIPATRVARTANGRHFYFRQPDDQRIRNTAGKLAPGIDTRGDGGYVVAPPSIHPSGASYGWDSEADVVTIPTWMSERLIRQQPERKPMPDINLFGTSPYGKAALEEEINGVAVAPEGTRNDSLNRAAFALGQLVAGGEVDQSDAWRSLEAAALASGLTISETNKTIHSGFAAGLGEPRKAPESNGQRPALHVVREPESAQPTPGMYPLERWPDFKESAAAPIDFLVDGLWPVQSLGFIASPPKKGKTWLGLSLAISVSTAATFLGEFPVATPRNVLYLALEGARPALRDRLGCLARGMNVDPESDALDRLLISYRPRGIDLADEAWTIGLKETVNENDIELVIVDVLRNAAVFKESDASEFARIRILLEETLKISSIALLHHFTKLSEISKERTPAERMSGSGAMYGALDVGMFITGSEENGRKLGIDFDGRDIAMPDRVSVYLEGAGEGPNGGFTYTDTAFWRGDIPDVEEEDLSVPPALIIDFVRDRVQATGGLVSTAEIKDHIENEKPGKGRTAENMIRRLVDTRRLFRPKKGFYTTTPEPTWADIQAAAVELQHETGKYGHPLADVIERSTGGDSSPPQSNPEPQPTENAGSTDETTSTSARSSDPTSTASTDSAASPSPGTTNDAPPVDATSTTDPTPHSTAQEPSASGAPRGTSTDNDPPPPNAPMVDGGSIPLNQAVRASTTHVHHSTDGGSGFSLNHAGLQTIHHPQPLRVDHPAVDAAVDGPGDIDFGT